MKRYIFFIILLPLTLYSLDLSTPTDGNLYYKLEKDVNPMSIKIYDSASVLTSNDLILKEGRIYHSDVYRSVNYQDMSKNTDDVHYSNKYVIYLTGDSNHYKHGILGDTLEPNGFKVLKNNSSFTNYTIDNRDVFETLRPTVSDFIHDNSGPEILLTRSNESLGARIDVYSITGKLLGFSNYIGKGYRWLHLLGTVYDNKEDINYVISVKTPHINGILEMHIWDKDRLLLVDQYNSVSTHKIGEDNLNTAVMLNSGSFDNPLIIVPSFSYRELKIVEISNKQFKELTSYKLPSRVTTNLYFDQYTESILFGLSNGQICRINE